MICDDGLFQEFGDTGLGCFKERNVFSGLLSTPVAIDVVNVKA